MAMANKVPKINLSNGKDMPVVGLGTYARKAAPQQFRQAVEWGIEAGYRHIDTASSYNNEEEVGEGINNKIQQGFVSREDLFITTKIQRGIPVIPKSFTKSRIEENLDLFNFELDEEEMKVVDSFNIDHRCVPAASFKNLKNFPF